MHFISYIEVKSHQKSEMHGILSSFENCRQNNFWTKFNGCVATLRSCIVYVYNLGCSYWKDNI